MSILYKKALDDYVIAKLILKDTTLHESAQIYGAAYHIQQAYEKLFKAYLETTKGQYPRTHYLGTLYTSCGIKHEGIGPYLDALTDWEAGVRYDNIHISKDALTKVIAMFEEVYSVYYIEVLPTKERVKLYVDALNCEGIDVDKIVMSLPKSLPTDEESFNQIVAMAIKVFYPNGL